MQDFFIRQNIDRYRKLLAAASDENERTKFANLLSREETRLSHYLPSSGPDAATHRPAPPNGHASKQ